MKIEIRPFEKKDVEAVCELESISFSMPWARKDIEALAMGGEHCYFVLLLDGEIAGFAGYSNQVGEGYVNNVLIAPKYRGKGFSKPLMQAVIDAGHKNGINDFSLEVRVSNLSAIKLYESLGFVNYGKRKNFYEKPVEDAYVYWLKS